MVNAVDVHILNVLKTMVKRKMEMTGNDVHLLHNAQMVLLVMYLQIVMLVAKGIHH